MRETTRRIVRSIGGGLVALTLWDCSPKNRIMAQPAPLPSLKQWSDESNAVVIGRVSEVHELGPSGQGSPEFQRMTASVRVDHVFKGRVDAEVLTIEYNGYPHAKGSNTVYPNIYVLRPDMYGILFLTSLRDGVYTFADPYRGLIATTSRRVGLAQTAHTTEEKVEAELFASLSDADSGLAQSTLGVVRGLGRERFIAPLHALVSSTDPEVQGLALAALIKLLDYSRLIQAIHFVEERTQDPDVQYWQARTADAIRDIGTDRIRRALENGGDKRAVYCPSSTKFPFDRSVPPLLDSLLSSPNIDLRRAAAHALRGICDPSSARFLAHALNGKDGDVRYDAMMGLAALEDFPPDRPAPARGIFNASSANYLDTWKVWWETAGKRKYSEMR